MIQSGEGRWRAEPELNSFEGGFSHASPVWVLNKTP
jgi:hypothetical protein